MGKLVIFLTVFTLGFSLNAKAEKFQLKPGLWDIRYTSQINGEQFNAMAKMNESMKAMPAAQREKLQKIMSQKGIGMGSGNAVKICHTKESQDQALVQSQKEQKCKIEDRVELKNGIRFKLKCENGSGQSEYHKVSENNYKGWTEMETARGKMKMEFYGKFLSANCGDIKPFSLEN